MSQIGRSIKNLETPRPLKSTIKQHYNPNFELNTIEDLISLTETVASGLANGSVSAELFNKMSSNLSIHGPQLEIISKEILDRCFIAFRNASQDDRLKISIRLTLLQLIELRANSWQISDGLNTYYKHKAATNVEPENDLNMLSTSPSMAGMVGIGGNQALSPGEIVKNSGKFTKPTKIPGKNYSKDEIVIRNADSGKVMGIKGRRVHMIEELSDTVISFQRVNPGAKERLVQITGPNEEKINYAKMLIEDTIKRNASPIREQSQEGSCSSLASSTEEQTPRNANHVSSRIGMVAMPVTQHTSIAQHPLVGHNKLTRSHSHHNATGFLAHSLSTSDASLGEYKYTVSIGNYNIKVTGDCCELVREAKLVLDDHFTAKYFLESNDLTEMDPNPSSDGYNGIDARGRIPSAHQLAAASQFMDSGINLDLLALSPSSSNILNQGPEIDDDVFATDEKYDGKSHHSSIDSNSSSNSTVVSGDSPTTPTNGLSRSRRSHFSKKDSAPEMKVTKDESENRIIHTMKSLWWFYLNLPLAKIKPDNWNDITVKTPNIVRSETLDAGIVKYSDVSSFLEMRERMDIKNKEESDIIVISDD